MKRYRYFILLALPVLTLYSVVSWSEVARAYTVDSVRGSGRAKSTLAGPC